MVRLRTITVTTAIAFAFCITGVTAACGAVLGIEPLDFATASEAGSLDGATPPPIDQSVCLARVADEATGVFVHGDGGSDSPLCGAISSPCKSVGAGIARAAAQAKHTVFVAGGTYVEAIVLMPGIAIEGAWSVNGASWIPSCADSSNTEVTLAGTTTATIVADDLDGGEATLSFLTVQGPDGVKTSESVYGIIARGDSTKLVMQDVIVNAGKASDGVDGVIGENGSQGTGACDAGSGQPNTSPVAEGSALPGTFTQDGYVPGNGTLGGGGGAGDPGTSADGQCVACILCSGFCGAMTTCGEVVMAKGSCGSPGIAGCAGSGGSGGAGGNGGGSSIALYLWAAHADVRGGSLRSNSGGRGGRGGNGGNGGDGAPGATGAAGSVCNVTDFCSCTAGNCGSNAGPNNKGSGPGGAGSAGGHGANGGSGGGGAGGSSFAIYLGAGATADQSRTPQLLHADPALGGAPNGPPGGANGVAP